ncbi:MAG: glycoside hydrolase family 5 protein [Oscillospiraceae bacterium]|nr:glycoside hydrolase family 5 protein [Oscillospiraceae bacterium]
MNNNSSDIVHPPQTARWLGLGWNLGNSLESYKNGRTDEIAWGNPKISRALLNKVKKVGFDTVRIPVSYLGRIGDAPDYRIEEAWLARIREVVDAALDAQLNVIINIHHDGNNDWTNGAWIDCTAEDQTQVREKFARVWEQIAKAFSEHDARLIFESMNEIHDGTYQRPEGENGNRCFANINALNQIFVDTVRASGGRNVERWLLVPGYNTNIGDTLRGFVLPKDSAENRLMLSVHFYDPFQYALEENFNTTQWGRNAQGNCGWGNEDYIDELFQKLEDTYIKNGIPVVLGEFGAINKNSDSHRRYYMEYVVKAAYDRGIPPMYWDNGYDGQFGMALLDRYTGEILHEDILLAMLRASSGTAYDMKQPMGNGDNTKEGTLP